MEVVTFLFSCLVAVIISLVLFTVFDYFVSDYGFWKRRGVPTQSGVLPFFGNTFNSWKKHLFLEQRELVKEHGKVYGWFDAKVPWLTVADPDLLKQVCIKDFESFANRQSFPAPIPYVRRFLSDLEGEEWKKLRTLLSPLFTSGKLKAMTPLIVDCASHLVKDLEAAVGHEGGKVLELKPIYSVFTTAVMASTGFGMTSRVTVNDPFIRHTRAMFVNSLQTSFIAVLPRIFPALARFIPRAFPTESLQYFIESGKKMAEARKEERKKAGADALRRNDFLDCMLDIQEDDPEFFDDECLVGQVVLFLLAGTDTTSNLILMVSYELARHPDVQEKLRAEIEQATASREGQTDYEFVHGLAYLEQVLNETERLWPATGSVARRCTRPTTLGEVDIPMGTNIQLAMYCVQRSEELWAEPDEFIPERFEDKTEDRHPMAFFPFGQGPRNCIGTRLGQLVVRIALVHLVTRFRFEVAAETDVPPNLAKGMTQLHAQGLKIAVMLRSEEK